MRLDVLLVIENVRAVLKEAQPVQKERPKSPDEDVRGFVLKVWQRLQLPGRFQQALQHLEREMLDHVPALLDVRPQVGDEVDPTLPPYIRITVAAEQLRSAIDIVTQRRIEAVLIE